MLLPICGLVTFAWWREKNPPSTKPKFGITAQIIKETPYPVDVWAGRDTRVVINVKGKHLSLPEYSAQWVQCVRVVARTNGKDRLLFRSDDLQFGAIYRKCGPNYNFYVGMTGKAVFGFALRDVPRDWGEIWLELDVGLRPVPDRSSHKFEISAESIARFRKQPGAVWTWESKSLLLRGKDEIIELPVVSKNPYLSLKYHLAPVEFPLEKTLDRSMLLHFANTFPDSQGKESLSFIFNRVIDWHWVDEKGIVHKYDQKVFSPLGPEGMAMSCHAPPGGTIPTAEVEFSSKLAPKAHKLRLKAAISCDNRWPLMIDIPLLDRTEKTTARSPAHR